MFSQINEMMEKNKKQKAEFEAQETKRCAACGTSRKVSEMLTCMDSRPMHRYVCNTKCMKDFYA